MLNRIISLLFLVFFVSSCQKEEKPIVIYAGDYHNIVDKITEIMVHDIFSPPVASRVYAYSNIAAYEIVAQNNPSLKSFSSEYKDFSPIPLPRKAKEVNYRLAALIAQMETGKHLIFSEEKIESYRDSLYDKWKKQNEDHFIASKEYGLQVAEHMKKWVDNDNYKETRTMPKFSVYSDDPSRWQPTPPLYMDGIEPHWAKIRPFSIDSASQFQPAKHPEFSLEENSEFHSELMEVYNVRLEMEKKGDESEEIQIARFWDCNPYLSTQRGHMMFATKKISPGGHWMGICKIAAEKNNLDFDQTSYAYTATAIALADAFISCWDEKYRSELIRPETLINKYVDDIWAPVLQTPPFPEYPSGHSVISGAASTVLTRIFGEDFSFLDDTEVKYGLPARSFTSFNQAAEEAALSRLYGGIHYRAAIDKGLVQGNNVGMHVVQDLDLNPLPQQ